MKGTTEDEMVRWHHQLDGHEFGDGQGRPGVLQSMGSKELDTTKCLNNSDRVVVCYTARVK